MWSCYISRCPGQQTAHNLQKLNSLHNSHKKPTREQHVNYFQAKSFSTTSQRTWDVFLLDGVKPSFQTDCFWSHETMEGALHRVQHSVACVCQGVLFPFAICSDWVMNLFVLYPNTKSVFNIIGLKENDNLILQLHAVANASFIILVYLFFLV